MHDLVILVDVDYTLLDGACVRSRITATVEEHAGPGASTRFWARYDAIRERQGYVHVPQALGELAIERGVEPASLLAALEALPFADCLYAGALQALAHLGRLGLTVVLSDGDARFQHRKIEAAGIASAVEGRVLVTPGKVARLDEVRAAYPAPHYALLDDRASILGEVKQRLGEGVTTVLVRHDGARYAEEQTSPGIPPPDVVLPSIRSVLDLDAATLAGQRVTPAPGAAS